jgi:hypothetical protein
MPYIGAGIQRFNTADSLTVNGDAEVTGTVNPSGDTASGDAAALGFTSAEGLILTGQGSTSDITLKNDADATVFSVPTGTDDILFPDSAKILMGAGSDLQIYHDGSNSYIDDAGTGTLNLRANAALNIKKYTGEIMLDAVADGAVTLRHDNSIKFATTSTGVDITGGFTATDGCTITTADNDPQLTLVSTDADGSRGPELLLYRNSASPANSDALGFIRWDGENDSGAQHEYIKFEGLIAASSGAATGAEQARLDIRTMVSGTDRSRIDIDYDGTVINQEARDLDFRVESSVSSHHLFIEGNTNYLLIGKSDSGSDVVGCTLRTTGQAAFTMDGNGPLVLNRKSSDGDIVFLQKDNSAVGSIGTNESYAYIAGTARGLRFGHSGSNAQIVPVTASGQGSDDNVDLGAASLRFDDVYATTGTIQTSDQNEKQNIASLTTAEMTAAKAISKLFKTFKWQDKVAAKGDAARTHTGVIAQEVQQAMTDAGLDASKYAFWCSDTWWETSTEVAAVEAVAEAAAVYDDDGNLVTPPVDAVPAKDAYTRIDTYNTADEAPEGATQRTRLGIRYPELLAFVGAATEQRLADIETRLTALEAGE